MPIQHLNLRSSFISPGRSSNDPLKGIQSLTLIRSKIQQQNAPLHKGNHSLLSKEGRGVGDIICEQKCHHNVTELETLTLQLGFDFLSISGAHCEKRPNVLPQSLHYHTLSTHLESLQHAIIALQLFWQPAR